MSDLAERVVGVVRDIPDFPSEGILFRDLSPMYARPDLFADVRDWLAALVPDATCVAGIEARGFLLGAPVALECGLPFVPVRKAGKLPGQCHALSYDLEYGQATIEVQVGAIEPGARVVVIDDVLATGGTAAATVDLIRRCGAEPVVVAVLLELGSLGGRELLNTRSSVPVTSLAVL